MTKSKPIKKKTVEEIIGSLAMLENVSAAGCYKILSPAFTQAISDIHFNMLIDLIEKKLGDARFDLYLQISLRFIQKKLSSTNRQLLINRLYAPIKTDVRDALNLLSPKIISALDLLMSSGREETEQWLRLSENREELIGRAKLCFIYIALKKDRRQTINLELLLLSVMEKDTKIRFDKHTGKLFTDILLSKNPFGQVEKLAYFHYNNASTAEDLREKLAELQSKRDILEVENANRRTELVELKAQVKHKNVLLSEQEDSIAALKAKVKTAEDRLEYETHRFDLDKKAFKLAFSDKLKHRLATEIEGMNTTVNRVEEPEKSRLQRRIANIQNVLEGEGSK